MPYPNYHSARIANSLADGIFATKQIAPSISIILQKPKDDNSSSMKIQSYRFDKNQYTAQESKSWLKKHDIRTILFEPASEPSNKETRQIFINRIAKEFAGAII